jgi:hypothetical protein
METQQEQEEATLMSDKIDFKAKLSPSTKKVIIQQGKGQFIKKT